MSFHLHLHDKLLEAHRQTLQQEMAHRRMLIGLSQHRSQGRRAIGKLGAALVALGSRLEQFEHHGEPAIQSVDR